MPTGLLTLMRHRLVADVANAPDAVVGHVADAVCHRANANARYGQNAVVMDKVDAPFVN